MILAKSKYPFAFYLYNQFSKINSVQKISSGSIGRITKIMGYSTKIIIVPEVTVNLSVVSQILFYSYDWIGLDMWLRIIVMYIRTVSPFDL